MAMTFQQGLAIGAVGGLFGGLVVGCSIGLGMGVGRDMAGTDPAAAGAGRAAAEAEEPADAAEAAAAVAGSGQADAPVESEAPAPVSDWRVTESTEEMTDEPIRMACARSSNQVQLDFPYGARSADLCIRRHPRFGQDVFVSLNGSGQILCTSYDGCTIRVRFDDGEVQSFSAAEPSDGSSETLFVTNDTRFIGAARSASRIRVQLEFYQNGVQTFDFPARGLDW